MVEQKICSFCGDSIEPGSGRLYVRKDGMTFNFCSNKCFKNMINLKRLPRETEWTAAYAREKEVRLSVAAGEGGEKKIKRGAPAKKVRKAKVKIEKKEEPAEGKKE